MKILFIARHCTYFRNFESAIRLLAGRGHRIHLAAEREEASGGRGLVERLARECEGVTTGCTPARADARRFAVATAVRLSTDYFRYLDGSYDDAPALRARARERTPRLALALARLPGRRATRRLLRAAEHAIPLDAAVHRFVAGQQPDAVLLTPLIELGSPQIDYLKSARALGVPSALCVWSWDHLTSKALIRTLPDRVLVWNETQRHEAETLHGVPRARIVVTGAQCFDDWFGRRPSRARAAFARDAGLPSERPFVLYVCSSLFRSSPPEAPFVRRWLEALRRADDASVRDVPVLIRPHPQRPEWDGVDLSDLGPVALWGASPVDAQARADYFDSMYHAAAVVGLNTSALIESAIVDRPVHTILTPEYAASQTGTHHFRYLIEGPHAYLRVATSFEEHTAQLARALAGEPEPRNRRFVEHFVRPRGVDQAATPVFADAVEALAGVKPETVRAGAASLLRPLVSLAVAGAETEVGRRLLADPAAAHEHTERDRRIARKRALVAARDRARREKAAARRRRWAPKRRQARIIRLKSVVRRLLR